MTSNAGKSPMNFFLRTRLLQWRGRLIPEELQLGWAPFYSLGYLVFVFLPLFFHRDGTGKPFGMVASMLWPTLITVAVFLPLYFKAYRSSANRSSGALVIACMLAIAGLGYLLLPFNAFANTYLIYAVAFAAHIGGSLAYRLSWIAVMLGGLLVEIVVIGYPIFIFAITAIMAIAVFFGNYFFNENTRKRAELELSHDEVRRLAALAERERIGRDLHDLLGHTLSLIALKSELAGKLLDRDALAARREIDEVTRVARDALSQVRRAVTGIRAAGLAAELASAKLLLESDDVIFRYTLADIALPVELETVFALTVREAVTNIQRHARARRAEVLLENLGGHAILRINDDGRGSAVVPGNGLCGMRERIEALGGSLRIDSTLGKGTRIAADLPLPDAPMPVFAASSGRSVAMR
jgi:two-component system sensor histidine kinase DesK